MGDIKPPTPMTKLGPRQMRGRINELRDYLVAKHIQNWQFNQSQNSFQNTSTGVLVKLRKSQLFLVEFEQGFFSGTVDVSDQLTNALDLNNLPAYISPTSTLTGIRGTILGGFFGHGFGDPLTMSVRANGQLVSFDGNTSVTSTDPGTSIAADANQPRVTDSLVFEITGTNDLASLFVWGVMP